MGASRGRRGRRRDGGQGGLHGGVREPAAAGQLSRPPEPLVLVDARNVLRSQWPNFPEDVLVDLCREWAEENDTRVAVVFDGEAPGALVGERELDARCLMVGTGASESADEWLTRTARKLAADGRRYRLVTSDRALREAAGRAAEQTIGGGTFARMLSRRP